MGAGVGSTAAGDRGERAADRGGFWDSGPGVAMVHLRIRRGSKLGITGNCGLSVVSVDGEWLEVAVDVLPGQRAWLKNEDSGDFVLILTGRSTYGAVPGEVGQGSHGDECQDGAGGGAAGVSASDSEGDVEASAAH